MRVAVISNHLAYMNAAASQYACSGALLVATAFGLLGFVERWAIKDRKAAFLSWLWGGLIAIPGLLCMLSNSAGPVVLFTAVIVAVGGALWWQRRKKLDR
jgi:hypothetical protein